MRDFEIFMDNVKNGNLNEVKNRCQSDFLERENYSNQRPIHYACWNGHLEIVKFLVKNECSIECKDKNWWRPIHCACRWGHLDVVQFLCEAKCELDCETKHGQTPAEMARSNGEKDCENYLNQIRKSRNHVQRPAERFRSNREKDCESYLKGIPPPKEYHRPINVRNIVGSIRTDDVPVLVPQYSPNIFQTIIAQFVLKVASLCGNERLMVSLLSMKSEVTYMTAKDFKLAFTNKWFKYATILISLITEGSLRSYITEEIFHLAIPYCDSKLLMSLFIKSTETVQKLVYERLLHHFALKNEYGDFLNLLDLINQLIITYDNELSQFNWHNLLILLFRKLSISKNDDMNQKLLAAIYAIIDKGGDIYKETLKGTPIINYCTRFKDIIKMYHNKDSSQKFVEKKICTVCLDKEVSCAFGCGHIFCMGCADQVNRCPLCQSEVTTRMKLYLG